MAIIHLSFRRCIQLASLHLAVLGLVFSGLPNALADPLMKVQVKNNLVSISAEGAPLLPILQRISRSAGIQIVVLQAIPPRAHSVHISGTSVEKTLSSLLRGYDYAVLYSVEPSRCGVHIMETGAFQGPENPPNSVKGESPQEAEKAKLVARVKKKDWEYKKALGVAGLRKRVQMLTKGSNKESSDSALVP